MKKVIFSGAAFAIGNVIWPVFDEPKLFYVPLALFLFFLLWEVKGMVKRSYEKAAVDWLITLSAGNIVKQGFYTETIAQINDYVFGALVTLWLFFKLGKIWATKDL